jgi:hypothetical protein
MSFMGMSWQQVAADCGIARTRSRHHARPLSRRRADVRHHGHGRSVNPFIDRRVEHRPDIFDRSSLLEEIRGGEQAAAARFAGADDPGGLAT